MVTGMQKEEVVTIHILTRSLFLTYFIQPGGGFGDNGHLMDEGNSIRRSSQMVDSYLNIGKNTLSELYNQRSRFKVFIAHESITHLLTYLLTHSLSFSHILKDIQSKALDMLNYLGMSNNMMKTVEQRDFIDKIILFTCMVFTVVLMFALWWFVKYIQFIRVSE